MPTQIGSRQLRSSSAHCARKLAKSLAKSWQGGSGRGSGGRGGGGEGGGRGGGGGEGAGTAVIKSNNPHLAAGKKDEHQLEKVRIKKQSANQQNPAGFRKQRKA